MSTYIVHMSSYNGKSGDKHSKVFNESLDGAMLAQIGDYVENVIHHFHNKELAKNDPNHPYKG